MVIRILAQAFQVFPTESRVSLIQVGAQLQESPCRAVRQPKTRLDEPLPADSGYRRTPRDKRRNTLG